ncbi:MAG TPA: MCE family protein [Actinomycetales bacterium]|nr:MCE family protein [Actinomycetales bacterium]
MTPFRERNPVIIGAVGLLTLGLLIVLAFNVQAIPFLGGGPAYSAAFSEAGGLRPGDDVRLAGVKVGEVDGVELDGGHVRVDFRVTEPARFGRDTGATVRIKTLLGQKFLSLEPKGSGQLDPGSEIPLERTVSAYDVVDAFSDLAVTNERIDTAQLAQALDTMAAEFANTPDEVRAAVDGLSRLSRTIASRDEELGSLLARSKEVTGVLAERDAELTQLVQDANLLLAELERRRDDISHLLDATVSLSQQLTALVRENRKELRPALEQLHAVTKVLEDNKAKLEEGIELMAPFTRVFASTLGNGPWFDTYIQNLVPVPGVVPPGAAQGVKP